MTTLLLDTHVLHWFSAVPEHLSHTAAEALRRADELVVAPITWYELAWLAKHARIVVNGPVRGWLDHLSRLVRTTTITPAIADRAAGLPRLFPSDPADRLIYATALEHGWRLVTKDRRLRDHPQPRPVTVW